MLYHVLVHSPELRDGYLYTLNQLQEKHTDLYERHLVKYKDRPHVLVQRFPHLNCYWGDVVFFSPVHPDTVCAAMAECSGRAVRSFPYYEVSSASLIERRMAVWLFYNPEYDPDEVLPFRRWSSKERGELPDATIAYYESLRGSYESPLFMKHIPHVLYHGSVDLRGYLLQYTRAHEVER